MRVLAGLFLCLVLLTPGFAQSGPAVSRRRARPGEFFAHPEALCKALNQVGIETSDWDQIGRSLHAPFMCEDEHASATNRDISTIFRVSGNTGSRADVISIAVTVTAPSAREAGQEEFGRVLAALFQSIGQPEPPSLLRAIARRRYYLARRSYGVVWFNFVTPDRPDYQRVFWFRLSKTGPG